MQILGRQKFGIGPIRITQAGHVCGGRRKIENFATDPVEDVVVVTVDRAAEERLREK